MKTFLKFPFFAILLLAKPVFLQAQDCGDPDPKWKKCSATKECILIEAVCYSITDPVNRNFKMQVTRYNKCLSNYTDCVKVIQKPKLVAKCIKNICVAVPIKK